MEKIIITSALPYINGVKHLGNLVGSLLPADVFARYQRRLGKSVLFVCGTDEHGTPAELAAAAEGLSPQAYCDKYYEIQKDIYERFGLSFDYFGRTSSRENHESTQSLFMSLWRNGLIEERETPQLFSLDDNRFLPDRYVVGTCPNCGDLNAKGDQCEACGTLLDPVDLINPRSTISNSTNLEVRTSRHLYLNLAKMQERISDWVDRQTTWPKNVVGIARKWLNEGLRARCITRDLQWGIPVPLKGYEDKVFYVWFDAPIGYIGISRQWANTIGQPDLWLEYWKDAETQLVHFMAKDNVPFHTVIWPAVLMGADDGFILPTTVKGFEWLQYEGGKFSTSSNRGIFTDTALELFPADLWRYYLLKIAPEKKDTDFEWSSFQTAINKDLADTLGNFANRTLIFLNKAFDRVIPSRGAAPSQVDKRIRVAALDVGRALDSCRFNIAIIYLRDFWQYCNQFVNETVPFKVIKESRDAAAHILADCILLLRAAATISEPFVPSLAETLYRNLGIEDDVHKEPWSMIGQWPDMAGRRIALSPEVLVRKIEDATIHELHERFAGAQEP